MADEWYALLRWHGFVQLRIDRTEDKPWYLVEASEGFGMRTIGRGRTVDAACRAAFRDGRKRYAF